MRSFAPLLPALLATTALGAFPALAGPPASLTELVGMSHGNAMSADGSIIAGYNFDAGVTAVYWQNGQAFDSGIPSSSAFNGISADGSTMVGQAFPLSVSIPTAIAYKNGVMTTLTALSSGTTIATAANSDGSVILGSGQDLTAVTHPILWSGPQWQDVTVIDGLTAAGAAGYGIDGAAMANHPIVVGESPAADGFTHAFYWQDGVTHDMGTVGQGSGAYGISADGSTAVGYLGVSNTASHAAIWRGAGFGTVTDIGSLGGDLAFASATNADGSVVVGRSDIASNSAIHAFRYANGQMADLNSLLASAGVDMTGITLDDAPAISADGKYILADGGFGAAGKSYLAYYYDGVAALTNQEDQQKSVDELGKQRQARALRNDVYFGIINGDLDRQEPGDTVGAFAVAGSAVGGVRGKLWNGSGWTVHAGIADGTSESIDNGLYGAVSIRYDASQLEMGVFHPFGEIGAGAAALSGLDFSRPYNGGTGRGQTDGTLGTAYLRGGFSADFDSGDQLAFAAEIGDRWLSTGSYVEGFSNDNPFPAAVAGGTDSQTVGKLSATWSHRLSDDVDLTLRGAVGSTLGGQSGLQVATLGFGTLSTGIARTTWVEGGAHLTWNVSAHAAVDLYATGMAGGGIVSAAEAGAGFHFKY